MSAIRIGTLLIIGCAIALAAERPDPPARDPHTPGYVEATELSDGAVAPINANGNFIIGPTHAAAPEMTVEDDVPKGTVHEFVMESKDSKIYPGIARDKDLLNPNIMQDNMHDWVLANERMAKVLAEKGYPSSSHSPATPNIANAR